MNYFALAGGILSALIALISLTLILVTLAGKRRWSDPNWGLPLNVLIVVAFATAAVAWFRVAVAA